MSEQFQFEEEIKRLHERRPFVPFTVVLTSGDRYQVDDSIEFAMGGNTAVVIPARGGMNFFRKAQIVGIEVKETAAQ